MAVAVTFCDGIFQPVYFSVADLYSQAGADDRNSWLSSPRSRYGGGTVVEDIQLPQVFTSNCRFTST